MDNEDDSLILIPVNKIIDSAVSTGKISERDAVEELLLYAATRAQKVGIELDDAIESVEIAFLEQETIQ